MDVTKGALEPLRARVGDRIEVEGPTLRIKPRIATMLSLAMHEMGDNAAKYGSLSAPGGTVEIAWTISRGEIRLTRTENGGPPVSAPSQQGYGTRIIERVVAAEFEATVALDFPPEGVRLSIVAPTDRIGEEATEWRMSTA